MRRLAFGTACAIAFFAASVALAAASGKAASKPLALDEAAARTARAHSLHFQLTTQLWQAGSQVPYTLRAQGATAGRVAQIHLKVDDQPTLDGRTAHGPSADEKVDGTFLYLRSTATRGMLGSMWVRERLAALSPRSAELRALRQVSPVRILNAVAAAAQAISPGPDAGVFRAVLPYGSPDVRNTLAGLEGRTEFRDLRLTAWSNRNGMIRLVVISGQSPDHASRFVLSLQLDRYGAPVTITPPPASNMIDFELSKLAA